MGLDLVNASPCLRVLDVSIPVWATDVRDAAQMRGVISHLVPEVVFHLAGSSHIAASQAQPLEALEVNVQGTWNVLEACRNLPSMRSVVVASSNHIWGSLPKAYSPTCALGHRAWPGIRQDSIRQLWLEDDPPGQTDVYGTSKACVDLLTKAYGAMGIPVAALRHVNAHGPGDQYASHLITGAICDLLDNRAPIIRSDGSPLKAYLHVEDVCAAYLLVAESLAGGVILPGAAVNAGGPPISVLALVNALIQIAGLDLIPDVRGEDLSQSGYVEILDDSRLRSLGWAPRPLLEGLVETYNWYKMRRGMAWTG